MTTRLNHITAEVTRFLARLSPPASIRSNEQAIADTRTQIIRTVVKCLPVDGYTDLLSGLLDAIEARAETRAWPTVHEIHKAAKEAITLPSGSTKFRADPVKINVARFAAREAVPESWLFGRRAEQMLRAGVAKTVLDEYRNAAMQERFEIYGEDVARAWADQVKARHKADLAADADERRAFAQGHIPMPKLRRIAPVNWD